MGTLCYFNLILAGSYAVPILLTGELLGHIYLNNVTDRHTHFLHFTAWRTGSNSYWGSYVWFINQEELKITTALHCMGFHTLGKEAKVTSWWESSCFLRPLEMLTKKSNYVWISRKPVLLEIKGGLPNLWLRITRGKKRKINNSSWFTLLFWFSSLVTMKLQWTKWTPIL